MEPVYTGARGVVAGPPEGDERERRRIGRIIGVAFLVASLALAAVPPTAVAKSKPRKAKGRYVLPVAPKWAKRHKLDNRHHDYPAWDLAIPKGTSVKAVTAGRVTGVTRWGGCGNGVIIKGRDGFQYTYCHGTRVTTKKRSRVRAGQRIMLSGSTGHSTGPHLHLQIRSPHGRLFCPQPLLLKWARGISASPRTSSPRGCAYSPDRAVYRRKAPPGGRWRRTGSQRARKAARSDAKRRDAKRGRRKDPGKGRKSRSGRNERTRNAGTRRPAKVRKERKGVSRKQGSKNRRSARRPGSKRQREKQHRRSRDRAKRRDQRGNRERGRRETRSRRSARAAARARAAQRREQARLETLQRQAELALERRVLPVI